MYNKAHQALDYALSLTYGTHEETFQLLPSFGYVLEQKNPRTITDLHCDEDGKFLYFFMSLSASVRGFWRCMRPVIVVDENIKKRYHRKDVAAIMDKAAQTYIELKYNWHMEELRNSWSCVHCPDRRYRVMTTNVAECINSCLKFTRQLPMLTLAEFIRNMLQCWFHDRHRAAQAVHHQLTDTTHLEILKRVEKYNFMTVNPVEWNIFLVKQSGKQWTIDLARKTCTYNKFQMDHLLCSHALATGPKHGFTSLCVDYYKRQTLTNTYSVPIMPVGHPSTWIVPSDIAERVVLNPISRRQAGRSEGWSTYLVFGEDNYT
ncbi:hypothetical protein Ddye_008383 [Dipteronia dyeriana]|uniref:Zinc finger PMZ-type domain-containing protein n=1 Tax=Dipteronia dyeriana TaxID=168575 RepID=A0AAE0CLB6_9ROSI|nr:hypothetical protein Ddye_008383 [Dipteronia dyeriana]